MSDPGQQRHICIVGGGIIGVCTAYYLLLDPSLSQAPIRPKVTLIEEYEVAGAASGKAGGFLALDWHGPATSSLAALSYRLHQELADKFGGENIWGYRCMTSVSMNVPARSLSNTELHAPEPNFALEDSVLEPVDGDVAVAHDWLSSGAQISLLGNEDTTAQVHPGLFTKELFARASELGLEFVHGSPTKMERDTDGNPASLLVGCGEKEPLLTVQCTDLLLTAGPWTAQVAEQLSITPVPPVTYRTGHSILIRPSEPVSALAIFAGIFGANDDEMLGAHAGQMTGSPEFFPRSDGTVYVAGENTRVPIPKKASEVGSLVRQELIAKLVRSSAQISERLAKGKVEVEQLCYRPLTPDDKPLVGELASRVWVATGHGPWGITLAPGTGLVMSEMILHGEARSATVSALAPNRFQ